MIISVASQQGGTGKTSTSVSLAAGLAHQGKRVLLIDIDSQANSSKVLLRHYAEITKDQTIHHTILTADLWWSTRPMSRIFRSSPHIFSSLTPTSSSPPRRITASPDSEPSRLIKLNISMTLSSSTIRRRWAG